MAPVQDKNFYLLSMLDRTPSLRAAVKGDATLTRIATERLSAMDKAAKSCKADSGCYFAVFQWSEAQSADAGHALAGLYRAFPAVRAFADGPFTRKRHVRSL
jgi:hypothetical protein